MGMAQSTGMAKRDETWTILGLIQWATEYLTEKRFESPRLTVELLLAHLLRCDRIRLYVNHDKPLTNEELQGFKSLLRRRLAHEPVQYITGSTNFMGLELCVDRRVLIPRPETEELVAKGLELLDGMEVRPRTILDVGTGSGCIAIALAHFRKDVVVDAIDVSSGSLDVAMENVKRHELAERVNVISRDIRTLESGLHDRTYDLLISNPPYVSQTEQQELAPEIRLYEPPGATTDGGDGLTFYRIIASGAKHFVRTGGAICLEVGFGQSDEVATLLKTAGCVSVSAWNDFAGVSRIVTGKVP
jgi:release factor glutamine methyltransferase